MYGQSNSNVPADLDATLTCYRRIFLFSYQLSALSHQHQHQHQHQLLDANPPFRIATCREIHLPVHTPLGN
jgi:hypothetical protein